MVKRHRKDKFPRVDELTRQKNVERTPEMSWMFMLKLCHVQNPPTFNPMCIQKVIFLNLVALFKLAVSRKLPLLEAPNTMRV